MSPVRKSVVATQYSNSASRNVVSCASLPPLWHVLFLHFAVFANPTAHCAVGLTRCVSHTRTTSTLTQRNDVYATQSTPVSARSSFGGWNGRLGKQRRAKLYWTYCEYGFAQNNWLLRRQNLTDPSTVWLTRRE